MVAKRGLQTFKAGKPLKPVGRRVSGSLEETGAEFNDVPQYSYLV
jgi:hypothetical protein